jgi:hypothetical protein
LTANYSVTADEVEKMIVAEHKPGRLSVYYRGLDGSSAGGSNQRFRLDGSSSVAKRISRSNYAAYDCEFIAPARQLNVFLVTADKRLLNEFPDCAISLEESLK